MTANDHYRKFAQIGIYPTKYILDLLIDEMDSGTPFEEIIQRPKLRQKYGSPFKGAYLLDTTRKRQAVEQIDAKTGEVIAVYSTIYQAGKALGSVSKCAGIIAVLDKDGTAYTFKWRRSE